MKIAKSKVVQIIREEIKVVAQDGGKKSLDELVGDSSVDDAEDLERSVNRAGGDLEIDPNPSTKKGDDDSAIGGDDLDIILKQIVIHINNEDEWAKLFIATLDWLPNVSNKRDATILASQGNEPFWQDLLRHLDWRAQQKSILGKSNQ